MTTLLQRLTAEVEVPEGLLFWQEGIGEVDLTDYILAYIEEVNCNVNLPYDPHGEDFDECDVRELTSDITADLARLCPAGDIRVREDEDYIEETIARREADLDEYLRGME